eukprot:CAMPEP_0185724108 /NCGR_PEP_ID=MMETSP1171-20130828/690_1 /TAXON_ID=374046 /ORGANISM="Helicotheca tamensis, Strain CCMP826" /LENGTH=570 /DNA_ID=CAMNT_0028391891 /DNA_START=154 /DNA_END=1866 /DNA_ORIENTATION=+
MTATTTANTLSVLLAVSATTTMLVSAEQAPKELPWSAEKCAELGYSEKFDACAEIEFCEGDAYGGGYNGGRLLNRQLRAMDSMEMYGEGQNEGEVEVWDEDVYYDENGNSITEDVEVGLYVEDEGAGRPATFGWRIPGEACAWPGPLIRMSRGKRYGLFVSGSGNEETITNIHTHGLHVPGHGNADDVTRSVSGSDVIIYEYHIPSYHMGGTHWYHSHWHHNSEHHVGGGAFGMLIVDDGENVGEGVDAGVEAFLSNEKILIASNHEDIYGPWIVNGVQREQYDFNVDEWYRLRILIVNLDDHSSSRTISFGDECEAHAIAHDGMFRFQVPAAASQTTFSIGDASRLDVAIRCSSDSTISIYDEVVASIKTSSGNTNSLPSPFTSSGEAWSSTRPGYLVDLRDVEADGAFSIKLDETNINEVQYSLEKPLCAGGTDFKFDTIQEWTLSLAYHPFHLHIYPMQVVSQNGECGENHEYGEYYDTITIKHSYRRLYTRKMGKCKVRLAFRDVGGKTLMQCHVFKHGDQGSMAFIHVVGGPAQENEPRVHKCASEPCDEPVNIPLCEGGSAEDY